VAGFQVFLDLQPQHVCIDGQVYLVGEVLHLALLRLQLAPLLGDPRLELQFTLFARLHFFAKTLLVGAHLDLDLLVMSLEVVVDRLDLVPLTENALFLG
jgi:hypothetical protein